jgi:hypothetical protein
MGHVQGVLTLCQAEARVLQLRQKESSLLSQIKNEEKKNGKILEACSKLDQQIHAVKMWLAPLLGLDDDEE